MNREQQIEKASMYRCGLTIHRFDGGSSQFDSISQAKRAVRQSHATCVVERPGEKLYKRMQARWAAEEARIAQEAKEKAEREALAAALETIKKES